MITPWTKRDRPAAVTGRGDGRADVGSGAEHPPHAGIDHRDDIDIELYNTGTADRHWSGTPGRHPDGADHDGADHDGADHDGAEGAGAEERAHHHIVVPDREHRGEVLPVEGAGAGLAVRRERYPLVDTPRFWAEDICLRDVLRIAKQADHNLSHIPLVRAMHIAFFWLVTAPVCIIAFGVVWALVSFHRALAIAVIVVVAAQAVPVIPWLVVSSWTATTWQFLGAAVLVFGVGSALAAAGERRRR